MILQDIKWYEQVIDKMVADDMTNIDNLNSLFEMLLNLKADFGLDDKDLREYAMKMSKYGHEMAEYMFRQTGDDRYYTMYYQFLRFEGPYVFDSYMVYLERKRLDKQAFYLPKRKQLLELGIVQILQDLEDDVLDIASISMPPSTGKTTIEKFFVSWVIGRHPDDFSLFYSHSDDITKLFYEGVLDIMTNAEEYCYSEIFPNISLESTNAKAQRINFGSYKPYSSLQCTSIGAKNAGRVRCNRYLLVDDLIGSIEEAMSRPRLDKIWSAYAVDGRQRKMEGCKELHIATRWSVHDVIGRLEKHYEGSNRVRFTAIPAIDPTTGKSNFLYEYNGFSVKFFNDIASTMDEVSYKCLYDNKPIDREGILYHKEELRRYLSLPAKEPDAIISVADTKNKGTDFFVQPVLLQYGEDYYMSEVICSSEADYEYQYQRSTNLIVNNNVMEARFESNNGGDRVSFEVDKRVKEAKHYCNIINEPTTANKETKIYVFAPWVKQHVIFRDESLYTAKEDYGVFMEQLLTYSTSGKNEHDDVADCVAMLAKWRSKPEDDDAIVGKRWF